MVAITFPSTSYPGDQPQRSRGRLVNAMVEKGGDIIRWIRSPGVIPFATSPETVFRGMAVAQDGVLYAAFKDILKKGSSAGGALVTVAGLAGQQPVRFAFNQNVTPDQVVVTENGAFTFTATTVSGSYPDPDLPQPVDVCFGFGFFFFVTGAARCYASGINTTSIDPTMFVTAEGKPDTLYRCVFFNDQLYLLGPDSIEVWGKPVNATGFPLNRITMIPRGILGPGCVSGYENGCDLGLVIISGNAQVMRINGYQPERISEPDLERLISLVPDKTKIEMTTFGSMGGHMLLKIKCPQWCWIYDFTTQTWHERNSYLSVTSRLKQGLWAYGKWLIGDENSGNIGQIDPGSVVATSYREFGAPLIWQIDSAPMKAFPTRTVVGPAHFDFQPGMGMATGADPIQTSPQVMINWSDDGGLNFSNTMQRPVGRQGDGSWLTRVFLTGSFGPYGRIWRLRISDPVSVTFNGAECPRINARAAA